MTKDDGAAQLGVATDEGPHRQLKAAVYADLRRGDELQGQLLVRGLDMLKRRERAFAAEPRVVERSRFAAGVHASAVQFSE